jgi:hypothetical protein
MDIDFISVIGRCDYTHDKRLYKGLTSNYFTLSFRPMTYKEMLEKSRRDLPLILAAVASGRSQAEVAIEFDITKQAVSLKVCNAKRRAAKKRSKKP